VARGRSGTGKGLGGLRSTGSEAVQLVIDYVKQETLSPLRGLGRFIVFGVAGSVALAIGLVILSIAFLRVLQGETGSTFTGNWSWAPYLICTVAVVLVAAVAVKAVSRGQATRSTNPEKETP
jgi:Putative Actinobacterial Holin-X, holin superfamily III